MVNQHERCVALLKTINDVQKETHLKGFILSITTVSRIK